MGDGGGVISLWKWNGTTYDGPCILCRHNSTMNIQQAHPHPRFNAEGSRITGIRSLSVSEGGNFIDMVYG